MSLENEPKMPTTKDLLDVEMDREIGLNADIGEIDSQIERLQIELTNIPQNRDKQVALQKLLELEQRKTPLINQLRELQQNIDILSNTLEGENIN